MSSETIKKWLCSVSLISGLSIAADARADAGATALAILQDNTDGTVGVYLKEVDGPVLHATNEAFVFEPASTIKTMHHVHAMIQVESGAMSLFDVIPGFEGPVAPGANPPCFFDCPGPCPDDAVARDLILETTLRQMMESSHNARTQAVRVFFGQANINATGQALGMTNSLVQHRIGCNDSAVANPNMLTLEDIGALHEAVATDNILPTQRTEFYDLMSQGVFFDTVIDEEAAIVGLTTDEIDDFKARVRVATKGGSYGLTTGLYRSLAGWVRLPFDCEGAVREYVFGNFVDGASDLDTEGTGSNISVFDVASEQFRDEVRRALEDTYCSRPPTLTNPASSETVECDGMGNTAEFNAWRNSRGGATATDECGTISWSDSMGESGLCGETYQIGMTFTATSSDECFEDEVDTFAIFRVEDTQGAEVLCGSPATMSPNDAPIGFTSGASDTCCGDDTSAVIDSFRCYMINGAGREIDKGQSCEVSIEGDTIQIDDTGGTGGQGTFIEWTVSAVDCCGNASQQICAVEVVDPN